MFTMGHFGGCAAAEVRGFGQKVAVPSLFRHIDVNNTAEIRTELG